MQNLIHVVMALICTLCMPVWISDTTIAFSNSMFSVALFAVYICLFRCAASSRRDQRMGRYAAVLGFLFSAMTACGYALGKNGSVPYGNPAFLLSIAAYTYAFSAVICIAWRYLEKADSALAEPSGAGRLDRCLKLLFKRPACIFILLLLCWLPCYLSTFPGNFIYDATEEYYQITKGYDGDFPMLHSALTVRLIAYAHALTGSYNAGIAIYVIVQMLLLAALFTHILTYFAQIGINHLVLGAMLSYYALFPVIALLVTCTVRDVLFSGLLVYTIFLLYRMCRDRKTFFSSMLNPAALGTSLVLTYYARNNNAGVPIAVMFALVGLLIGWTAGKENRKGRRVFFAALIGCYAALAIILPLLCRPMNPPTTGAALSLMTQSINRAYKEEKETWTTEEKETWTTEEKEAFQYFFKDADKIGYNPKNGDSTKFNYVGTEEEFGDFLALWLKVGLKHPQCYADAILANTRQMWFPDCVVDGYLYNDPEYLKRYEKSYFCFEEEIDSPGVHRLLLPGVRSFYNKIAQKISFERVPVISMLFSIGFQFWLLLNGCFWAAYKKAKSLYPPLTALLLYMLLSACAPLVLLRYYSAVFFAMPILLAFTLQTAKAADL